MNVDAPALGPENTAARACAILLATLLGVSACASKAPSSGAKPETSADGRAIAPVPAPALTSNGLGSLNDSSAFEQSAVQAELDRFDISQRLLETGQGLEPVLLADYEGDPAVEVYADASGKRIGRIDLVGPALEGPDGLRVGSQLRLQPRDGFACAPGGPEGLQGRVLCARKGNARVTFVYDHGWHDDENALPPPEVLVRARLERMIWTAKKT